MSEEVNQTLILQFTDQSPSFAAGFEAGCIWARLKQGDVFENETVNSDNIPIYETMAKRFNYDFESTASEVEGWHYLNMKHRLKRFERIK